MKRDFFLRFFFREATEEEGKSNFSTVDPYRSLVRLTIRRLSQVRLNSSSAVVIGVVVGHACK